MSLSGAAFAQTNVTLFGILDATVQVGSGDKADKTALGNSGFNSSRFGVQGTEDIAGGMKAGFWLEAALNNDDGSGGATQNNNQTLNTAATTAPTVGQSSASNQGLQPALSGRNQGLTFGRRSTVSLGGSFGEVRLGRDYTPHFWTHTVYDPFGTNGVGTSRTLAGQSTSSAPSAGQTAVRASNSVAYLYGYAFNQAHTQGTNGLHAALMYYMGENASNSPEATEDDGSGTSLRVGYTAKAWSVAVATGTTNYQTTALSKSGGDIKTTNVGANYNLGVANLMGIWNEDDLNGVKHNSYLVGATAPMGQGLIRASYSTHEVDNTANPTVKQMALGYVHNLSKRTQLYATYARVNNSGGATAALNGAAVNANQSSSGMDFGLKHNF